MSIKTYSEMIKLPTFEERYRYLRIHGKVGMDTFGYDRVFNQRFYTSKEWRMVRNHVIARDGCCDLACPDRYIGEGEKIYIHHLNPITITDINKKTELLLEPEFLITTVHRTHNAIHYGDESILIASSPIERTRNDTCPWRR
jgi:hypothetical protein